MATITRPHVLLLEDDRDLWMLVEDALGSRYALTATHSPEEALRVACEQRVDLFLIDLHLGVATTGLDVSQQLRAMASYRDAPIVALTAYRDLVGSKGLRDAGFTTSLEKPFRLEELLELVRALTPLPKEEQ